MPVSKNIKRGDKLLFYIDNGLGNLILLCSIFRALSKIGLKINIAIYYRSNRFNLLYEFLEKFKYIDDIIILPRDLTKAYDNYDHHIITKSPNREFLNDIGTVAVVNQNNIIWNKEQEHEFDFNIRTILKHILKYINFASIENEDLSPSLSFDEFEYSPHKLVKNPLENSIVICNSSNTGILWERKKFHLKTAFSFCSLLVKNGYNVYYVGGLNDAQFGSDLWALCKSVHRKIYSLAGQISFLDSMYLLTKSKGLITTDTAIMHVANMMNIPMAVIFGPTLVSKTGPIKKNRRTKILTSDYHCAPCYGDNLWLSCTYGHCMKDYSGEKIYDLLIEAIDE